MPLDTAPTSTKCGSALVWLEQLGVWACLTCEEATSLRGPVGGALRQRRYAARDAARGAYEIAALARRDALHSINRARLRRAARRGNTIKLAAIQRLVNRFDIMAQEIA